MISDLETFARVALIAKGLDDPRRHEEAMRYHKALVETLNATHTGGEQDALCVFEGIAHLVAQLTANLDEHARNGVCEFIGTRAKVLAPIYAEEDMGAKFYVEGLH